MNISDSQLREIAAAGGIKNADSLDVKRADNVFELGTQRDDEWESVFTLNFIVGVCSDGVEFNVNSDTFDRDAARRKMENLNLIEKR